MDYESFDKASRLPSGIALATLVSCQDQCCREDCDSWRTIYVDMIQTAEEGEPEAELLRFAICTKHLGEFVQDMILSAPGTLLTVDDEDENCGDPDCPVHGYLNEDEDDDDE